MKPIPVVCMVAAIVFSVAETNAQWVQTNGPSDGYVDCLAVNGTNLFAATRGGVFLSTDDGTSWVVASAGITSTYVDALAVSGTILFAGTENGVFVSTNNGTSWTAANAGLPSHTVVEAFAQCGSNLFAGTVGGVYLSTNNGTSWTPVNNGLTDDFVFALAVSGTNIIAGTGWGGVFLSTDSGTQWSAVNSGLPSLYIVDLAVSFNVADDTNLFCVTVSDGSDSQGVFLSTNNGGSWTAASKGLTDNDIRCLVASGSNLWAGSHENHMSRRPHHGGVFLSTDNGASWNAVNAGFPRDSWDSTGYRPINCLAVNERNVFAGTEGYGVWRRPLSEMITSVDPVITELPRESLLHQNYPNPFNPSSTIEYELPAQKHVSLKVFNMLGQEVAVLLNEVQTAGYKSVEFNGSSLPSGVYLYRLTAGEFVGTKKLVLLK